MYKLKEYHPFYADLVAFLQESKHQLAPWGRCIEEQLYRAFIQHEHGDMARWQGHYYQLPDVKSAHARLHWDTVTIEGELSESQQQQLYQALKGLAPWRKGPFEFFSTFIDTEWRSDWKWNRVYPHITPLEERLVLDVGCGSGYHLWKMYAAGARRVIGIDPSKLFFWQFAAVKKYVQIAEQRGDVPVDFVPIKMEDVPKNLQQFDTVFSMGILYHRRSPMDHLLELLGALRSGGQLVLETLVVEGEQGQVLMPEERYAMMRNVWFIPSVPTLQMWLRRLGFRNPRLVDQNFTSTEEQRSTEWMTFSSLKDFLDSDNPSKTCEGYPAPLRATILAEAP